MAIGPWYGILHIIYLTDVHFICCSTSSVHVTRNDKSIPSRKWPMPSVWVVETTTEMKSYFLEVFQTLIREVCEVESSCKVFALSDSLHNLFYVTCNIWRKCRASLVVSRLWAGKKSGYFLLLKGWHEPTGIQKTTTTTKTPTKQNKQQLRKQDRKSVV